MAERGNPIDPQRVPIASRRRQSGNSTRRFQFLCFPVPFPREPNLAGHGGARSTLPEPPVALFSTLLSPAVALPAMAISAFAGLRNAEVTRLDWNEVHPSEGFIEVLASEAKTASRRWPSNLAKAPGWCSSITANSSGRMMRNGGIPFFPAPLPTAPEKPVPGPAFQRSRRKTNGTSREPGSCSSSNRKGPGGVHDAGRFKASQAAAKLRPASPSSSSCTVEVGGWVSPALDLQAATMARHRG